MEPQYLAVIGALGGVLIGGFINYFASSAMKQRDWKLSLAKDRIALRQRIYAEFLAESQRLLTISLYQRLSLPQDVHQLNNLIAQITLFAPENLTVQARAVREHIFKQRSMTDDDAENLSFNALRQAFVEGAREDIRLCEKA